MEKISWVDGSLSDKDDFLVSALWRHTGGRDTSWKNLEKSYVDMISPNKIKIHFDKIPKRYFIDVFRKAYVKLTVRLLESSTNGLSWYNTIWIANENMHEGARPLEQNAIPLYGRQK